MDAELLEGLKRFFFPKEEVIDHWYLPVEHFQYATSDFYQMVEKELLERKVPGLHISRLELSEASLLTAKREYLRLGRERLVLDICACPFGTSYFFSVRYVELPLGIKVVDLLVFLVGLVLILSLLVKLLGSIWGIAALLVLLGVGMWVMRNATTLGIGNLDAQLLRTPVIGPLYEIVFRKKTYYREDTQLMYFRTVDGIVRSLVDQVTAAQGIKLLKRYERKPIAGKSYQAVETPLKSPDPNPAP